MQKADSVQPAHRNYVSTFPVQFVWLSWYLVDVNVENTLIWLLRCNSWSVSSLFALVIKPLFRCLGSTGSSVGLALAYWSSGPSSIPAQGEIFSTVNGVPLHTAIPYRPPVVQIWLKYCWEGRKIAKSSIHPSDALPIYQKNIRMVARASSARADSR